MCHPGWPHITSLALQRQHRLGLTTEIGGIDLNDEGFTARLGHRSSCHLDAQQARVRMFGEADDGQASVGASAGSIGLPALSTRQHLAGSGSVSIPSPSIATGPCAAVRVSL